MFGFGYESFVYGCKCDRCGQAFIANPLEGDRTDFCPACVRAAAELESARREVARREAARREVVRREAARREVVELAVVRHLASYDAHEAVFAADVGHFVRLIGVDEVQHRPKPTNTYCLQPGCHKKTTARGGCCSLHRCEGCEGPKDGRSRICNKCNGSFW